MSSVARVAVSLVPARLRRHVESNAAVVTVAINAGVYTVGGALPQAINIVLLPILTRYLTPADLGIFGYTAAVCAILSILGSLTIHTYILRNYFTCRSEEERRTLFTTVFAFLLVYNSVLVVVEFAVLPFLLRLLGIHVPFTPYFQLAISSTALEIMSIIPLTYFRVRERAVSYVLLACTSSALNAGLSIYLVVALRMGLLGRYYGQLGAGAAMFFVYAAIVLRVGGLSFSLPQARAALRFCLPLVPAQLFASWDLMSDRLILERLVPLGQLGVYAVGVSMVSAIQVFTSGLFRALEPRIYRLVDEGRGDQLLLRVKRYLLVLLVSIGSLLIVFSREIVAVLLGPAFRASYIVVSILAMGAVIRAFSGLPATYLLARGRSVYEPFIRLIGIAGTITFALVLVPFFGIYGAAMATVASSLCVLVALQWAVARHSSVHWGSQRDIVFVTVAFLAALMLLQIHTPSILASIAIKLALVSVPAAWLIRAAMQDRSVATVTS
jgi:O-antigen/teichoic acid export membrane protein